MWRGLAVVVLGLLLSCPAWAYYPGTVTVNVYNTSSSPIALPNCGACIAEITYAGALEGDLPASPLAGFMTCIGDGGTNFYLYNFTVKTTDATTIAGIAGSTGFVMKNTNQNNCFIYDGVSNWMVH